MADLVIGRHYHVTTRSRGEPPQVSGECIRKVISPRDGIFATFLEIGGYPERNQTMVTSDEFLEATPYGKDSPRLPPPRRIGGTRKQHKK
jgi:hypothetical protein